MTVDFGRTAVDYAAHRAGFPEELFRRLGDMGVGLQGQRVVFTGLETFSFDVDIPYSHEAWRGRMRTCNGIGATLPGPVVADFDNALSRMLASTFPQEPLAVPHRVWALIARSPA